MLARTTYFGLDVLQASTVYGKGQYLPLDQKLMEHLIKCIHVHFFRELSPQEYREKIRPKVVQSLGGLCRRSRGD